MFAIAGLGPTEIGIIAGIIVLLFGAKKVPELCRSLGQGVKEFKHASKNLLEDEEEEKKSEPADESKTG
ncbi:MAG: twin-arginine translocase TatA/TatE family subunit [Armatimonadota bacterium]|nr:twin-arginine translocase TatA/TatE family subunit [Armatimonadota bacterium]